MTAPSTSGIGGRVGFGDRPAIVVVDMSLAFTDPQGPLVCDLDETVERIARVLESARRREDIPIIFTTVAYGQREQTSARAMLRKMPAALEVTPGSRWVEIDPRLEPKEGEELITKVFPSAFFGTTLASYLISDERDSLIITGASTSGCVRATTIDAVSHGFQVVIPREAVGDRSRGAHEQNLIDIDLKYGDVVPDASVLEWLDKSQPAPVGDGLGSDWPVGGR